MLSQSRHNHVRFHSDFSPRYLPAWHICAYTPRRRALTHMHRHKHMHSLATTSICTQCQALAHARRAHVHDVALPFRLHSRKRARTHAAHSPPARLPVLYMSGTPAYECIRGQVPAEKDPLFALRLVTRQLKVIIQLPCVSACACACGS